MYSARMTRGGHRALCGLNTTHIPERTWRTNKAKCTCERDRKHSFC